MMQEDTLFGMEIPADLAAEQAVLGTILLDPLKMDLVRETLHGDEFHSKQHEVIFRRMVEISNSDDPVIDVVTLASKLSEHQELVGSGGVTYLSKLSQSVPSTAHVEQYAAIVRDKYFLRVSIKESVAIIQQAAAGDADAVIQRMQATANKLSDMSVQAKDFSPIKNVLMTVYEGAEQRYATRETNRGVTGLETGFLDLDKMTAGFQKNDLVIVAARPSVGKTAFALNIAQNVGKLTKETIALFSLEMSEEQLVQRMICAESMVDASKMRTGFFENEDWQKLSHAIGVLAESKIFIDDSPGLNVFEIRAKCRKLKKEQGLGMILIDYLQLISGRGSNKAENRQQEVSEISRTLKQLARELEVPVIALSQLSRNVEQRQDKRPMMSDLRESGSIEQDADIVAFLYRDDYYDKESEKKDIIEIIIAKQRNGPVGTVELAFMKEFNKFVNLNRNHIEQQSTPATKPKTSYYNRNKWSKRKSKED